ncbi:hypothetical protein J6590_039264, partial [Homalodisca vitripennis]
LDYTHATVNRQILTQVRREMASRKEDDAIALVDFLVAMKCKRKPNQKHGVKSALQ